MAPPVESRRREDARGLHMLAPRPEWLRFRDGQYGEYYTVKDITAGLAASAALHRGGEIVTPMGLVPSDHILAVHACMLIRAT